MVHYKLPRFEEHNALWDAEIEKLVSPVTRLPTLPLSSLYIDYMYKFNIIIQSKFYKLKYHTTRTTCLLGLLSNIQLSKFFCNIHTLLFLY